MGPDRPYSSNSLSRVHESECHCPRRCPWGSQWHSHRNRKQSSGCRLKLYSAVLEDSEACKVWPPSKGSSALWICETCRDVRSGVGSCLVISWDDAPEVDTCKALDGHIAKLPSQQAGQITPVSS